jgi:hypothetical protein
MTYISFLQALETTESLTTIQVLNTTTFQNPQPAGLMQLSLNSKSDNEIFAYDPSGNRTSDKNV